MWQNIWFQLNAFILNFLFNQIVLKNTYQGFHNNIKQHNCLTGDMGAENSVLPSQE